MSERLSEDRAHYVTDNLNFVHYILKNQFHMNPSHQDYEDLFQVGCVGLILSAIRFDETRGFKFTTYSYRMITGTIQRYKREQSNLIKIPRDLMSIAYEAIELGMQGIDNASIADILNITSSELAKLASAINPDSIHRPIGSDSDSRIFLEDVIADTTDSFAEMMSEDTIIESIDHVCKHLRGKNKSIWMDYIWSAYFGEKLGQKELAKKYDTSQGQISRILSRCKKMFAKYMMKDEDDKSWQEKWNL